jgi:hypothetical protein
LTSGNSIPFSIFTTYAISKHGSKYVIFFQNTMLRHFFQYSLFLYYVNDKNISLLHKITLQPLLSPYTINPHRHNISTTFKNDQMIGNIFFRKSLKFSNIIIFDLELFHKIHEVKIRLQQGYEGGFLYIRRGGLFIRLLSSGNSNLTGRGTVWRKFLFLTLFFFHSFFILFY